MDDVVKGVRYRLPLKDAAGQNITNWQEALRREKETLAEIQAGKFGKVGAIARQTFEAATDAYLDHRRLHTAEKTRLTDAERSRGLRRVFGETSLRRITAEKIVRYQVERKAAGVSGRTINLEVGLLRRSREMLDHYSHIRLDAKRRASESLETPVPTLDTIPRVAPTTRPS